MYAMAHQCHSWIRAIPFCFFVLTASQLGLNATRADEISWTGNAGNGQFFHGGNWSPAGVPQHDDIIHIGNLPGTAGETIIMGPASAIAHDGMTLSNGITLDMNGSELVSFDSVAIYGNDTRLIARPAPFLNQSDFQGNLQLGVGAHFELRDNVSTVLFPPSSSSGTISGRGRMITNAFNNNGFIQPDSNGGLILDAGNDQTLTVDLDGSLGSGSLQLTTPFSQLQVNAGSLTDGFNNTIAMAPGALLEMNINDGWHADLNSLITVSGFNNPAASQITGSPLTFGGTMNVSLAQGYLRVGAPTTITSTATINVGHTDKLEFDGNTVIQGGTFTMGQFAELQFDGPTTLSGGTFNTFANNYIDGIIAFNGETTWNGTVEINGAARQQGNATVSGFPGATINANRFDMDGLSDTVWNINSGLTVNAEMIATTSANRFEGTMNIGGGFSPRATINLTDPTASWTMGGTMNLNGLTHLVETKIAGSHMIVQGDLNVTDGRVRINADTTFSDAGFAGPAQVSITGADTELRMHDQTRVESGVEFLGDGMIFNAASGSLLFESGVAFNDIGLVNDGMFNIAKGAGIGSVDRFVNTGNWNVDIGGYLPGNEHDLLLVTGPMAELGGTLSVNLFESVGPDFIPQIGDEFMILASLSGINGTFDFDPISDFQGQTYFWDVQYNPHDVTLQLTSVSVPEPTAGVLLTAAGLVFGFRRRRRASKVTNSTDETGDRLSIELITPNKLNRSTRIRFHDRLSLSSLTISIAIFGGVSQSQSQPVEWNAGNGVWSNAGSWSPVGVPVAIDNVTIGNGADATVNLNQDAEIACLSILTGSALNTQSSYLNVNGDTLVSGFGGFAGLTPSRLILENGVGHSLNTDDLTVAQGARVQVDGGYAEIYDRLTIDNSSRVHGLGAFSLYRTGTSLINDGTIEGGTNYGLTIYQFNGGGFDLDGVSGNGIIQATDYDSVNNFGATLRFEGSHLADSFSGRLKIGSGAQLWMGLSDGWTVDSGGEFLVSWHPNTIETARIGGGALDFSGEINMLGTNGIVASDLEINSSEIRIREAARIDTSTHNVLTLGGDATSLVRVDGGEFTVGEQSRLNFKAPTEIRGGTFQTADGGRVHFNGDTIWNGNTTIQGFAGQNRSATVNGLGATIQADKFDLDGVAGLTVWNVNSSLVVNATSIESGSGNGFNGTLNIGGGILPRLTINLADPNETWRMDGEMNLSGLTQFYETRLAGSAVVIPGQVNVTGGRVRIDSDVTFVEYDFYDSLVSIGPADAALRMHGNTVVHNGVDFSGDGTLINAMSGYMLMEDGVSLNTVNFRNEGLLQIDSLAGIANVNRFENGAEGTWNIGIGGNLPGSEHDFLIVGGDAAMLDGFLSVDLLDLGFGTFIPSVGDAFTILASLGGVSGTFLNEPVSDFNGQQFHWSIHYTPHDVTLRLESTTVPEPSAGSFVASIALAVAIRRRRRSHDRENG